MTINYARESVIDFTKPFMNLGIGILFKVSHQSPSSFITFTIGFYASLTKTGNARRVSEHNITDMSLLWLIYKFLCQLIERQLRHITWTSQHLHTRIKVGAHTQSSMSIHWHIFSFYRFAPSLLLWIFWIGKFTFDQIIGFLETLARFNKCFTNFPRHSTFIHTRHKNGEKPFIQNLILCCFITVNIILVSPSQRI